jgi:tetratricopeptide (TPR) repeat protein
MNYDMLPIFYCTGHYACSSTFGRIYGEYQPAAFAYQMALHLDSHDGEALRGLGDTFFSLEDYEMAVACYGMAIRSPPANRR